MCGVARVLDELLRGGRLDDRAHEAGREEEARSVGARAGADEVVECHVVAADFETDLAEDAVGVRFQQIQKYECGANVVSAARLWWIALRLGVGMDYFFDGLHSDEQIELGRLPVGLQPAVEVGA